MIIADYDFGGNEDVCPVLFPVLYEIFSEKEDADNWLDKNRTETDYYDSEPKYGMRVYSYEVSEDLLYPDRF